MAKSTPGAQRNGKMPEAEFVSETGGDAGKKEIGKGPGKAKAKGERTARKCRTSSP